MIGEGPKPPSAFLRRQEMRLEDINTFSEQELLGLDEPRHDITSGAEKMKCPRIVAYIRGPWGVERAAEKIFPLFQLNMGEYHADSNPKGLFATVPTRESEKTSALEFALLRLAGVRKYELNKFFGLKSNRNQYVRCFSPAWRPAETDAREKREMYAVRHPDLEDFKKIHELLKRIELMTQTRDASGLGPEELFQPGKMPAAFPWRAGTQEARGRPIFLEEALNMILLALSGTMTMAEINRVSGRSPMAAHKIFHKSKLTPQLYDAIQSKLKRGYGVRRRT